MLTYIFTNERDPLDYISEDVVLKETIQWQFSCRPQQVFLEDFPASYLHINFSFHHKPGSFSPHFTVWFWFYGHMVSDIRLMIMTLNTSGFQTIQEMDSTWKKIRGNIRRLVASQWCICYLDGIELMDNMNWYGLKIGNLQGTIIWEYHNSTRWAINLMALMVKEIDKSKQMHIVYEIPTYLYKVWDLPPP